MHLSRHISLLLTLALAIILQGCPLADEPDQPAPRGPVDRTILIYMLSDNSLGGGHFDTDDLKEMTDIAHRAGFGNNRVIVYHDPLNAEVKLKEVGPTGIVELKGYDEATSSVDPKRMRQVFDDVRRIAPAADYGLILWSHSDAWKMHNTQQSAPQKAFGDDRGKAIDIPELAGALEGQGFSFVCFDCCFMANIESLYELRHVTPIVSASAIELPAPGMRYDINLPLLLQPQPDVAGSAKATFDFYDSLSGVSRTCAMSVIDMTALDDLADATRAIYALGTNPPESYRPQRYSTYSTCLYYDFGDYVEAHTDIPVVLMERWRSAMERAVIYHAATPMIWDVLPINAHSGLSTYIVPSARDAESRGYTRLAWWNDVVAPKFTEPTN